EPIKSVGPHTLAITAGERSITIQLNVVASKDEPR
ncbi:MAG: hypothetical protein G01um101472_591, partial [Parcubacteria group bacterium Gr01-1014_72]